MTLIGIIIALLLEHMLSHVARWREHAWFVRYATSLVASTRAPRLWNSAWGLALLLLPLLVGVALIQAFFHGGIFTLLGLPFSVAVLLLCLGPRDVAEEVHAYFDAKLHGDTDTVERIEHDLCSGPARLKGRPDEMLLVRGLLVQSHERLFGVLLWFFVAGPVGAVLYRTAAALPRVLQHVQSGDRLRDWALRLHALVAWVPVRIVALIYGLAGSTDDAVKAWRIVHTESADDWMTRTWRLLTDVGAAALQMEDDDSDRPVQQSSDEGLQAALGLVQRSLLILLGVLALFTLGGWLS